MKQALERAAIDGDVQVLEALLDAGADIDSLDRYGQTALMLAAVNGRAEAVDCLIRRGAALDVAAKYNLSALMLAIVSGHEAVALRLARAGADVSRTGSGAPGFHGKTALDFARERGMDIVAAEIAARLPPGG